MGGGTKCQDPSGSFLEHVKRAPTATYTLLMLRTMTPTTRQHAMGRTLLTTAKPPGSSIRRPKACRQLSPQARCPFGTLSEWSEQAHRR
eukprot:scaffold118706_cov67-Phaeocystis_antarctica.AAC.5